MTLGTGIGIGIAIGIFQKEEIIFQTYPRISDSDTDPDIDIEALLHSAASRYG